MLNVLTLWNTLGKAVSTRIKFHLTMIRKIEPAIISKGWHEMHVRFVERDFRRHCNASLAGAGSAVFKWECLSFYFYWFETFLLHKLSFCCSLTCMASCHEKIWLSSIGTSKQSSMKFLYTLTIYPKCHASEYLPKINIYKTF